MRVWVVARDYADFCRWQERYCDVDGVYIGLPEQLRGVSRDRSVVVTWGWRYAEQQVRMVEELVAAGFKIEYEDDELRKEVKHAFEL